MLGRAGQTSTHGAPGGDAARPAPLRANLSVLGRIVCHPSIRLASLGSCRVPPHPERASFRPLPSPRGGTASRSIRLERAPPLLACRQVIRPAEGRRATSHRHRARYGVALRSDLPGSMATRCLVGFGCEFRHHSRHSPAGGLCARLRRRHPRRARPLRPPRVPPSPSSCIGTGLIGSAVGEAEGGPRVFGWCRLAGRAAGATGPEHQTAGGPVREGLMRLVSLSPALGPHSGRGGGLGGRRGPRMRV